MTTEDHETISQNPSLKSGVHQGTLTKQPARPPALDTEIIDTIGSHQKSYVHPKPVIIRSHPDGRYEKEKGRHKNTLGPHQ